MPCAVVRRQAANHVRNGECGCGQFGLPLIAKPRTTAEFAEKLGKPGSNFARGIRNFSRASSSVTRWAGSMSPENVSPARRGLVRRGGLRCLRLCVRPL